MSRAEAASRMRWPRAVALVVLAGLAGCAETVAPGAEAYRPMPFLSKVTVTGNDVPGPLRIREAGLAFTGGKEAVTVPVDGRVEARLQAWINGHGQLEGRWERDGEVVDRVNVFITYGERLEVVLGGPEAFPTDRAGRHTVRFVVRQPEPPEGLPTLTYEVESPYQ